MKNFNQTKDRRTLPAVAAIYATVGLISWLLSGFILSVLGNEDAFLSRLALFISLSVIALFTLSNRLLRWSVQTTEQGRYARALFLTDVGQSITLPGMNVIFGVHRALTLASMGRLEEAAALCHAQIKRYAGKYSPIRENLEAILGLVYNQQGHYDQTIALLEPSVSERFRKGLVYDELGEAYLHQGNYTQAIDLFRQAITNRQAEQDRPLSIATSRAALAWALAANGQTTDATHELTEALAGWQLSPIHALMAEFHHRIGQTYRLLNQPAQARDHFQQAIDFDPNGMVGINARTALAAVGK